MLLGEPAPGVWWGARSTSGRSGLPGPQTIEIHSINAVCVDMGAGLWGWMYGFMFREEGYVMVWCCAGHMCVQGWQLWLFGVGQMQYTG